MRLALPLVLLALSACAPEAPSILWVQPAADGEWDDPDAMKGSKGFATIQAAIDAAMSGQVVVVPSGTYFEHLEMAEGVDVEGAGQDQTVIVGSVSFTFLDSSALEGVTLVEEDWYAGGSGQEDDGISVLGGSATLDDVGVHHFRYGVYALAADTVTVDSSVSSKNWYGVYSDGTTTLQLSNTLIASNGAGGIAADDTEVAIAHNTVVANAFAASSLYLTGSIALGPTATGTVHNNLVTSNYYGMNCISCPTTWSHNLVWGNTTDYLGDASASSSDLAVDPLFRNAAEGDFDLSATSPCIDAGTTSTVVVDHTGEVRPQGVGWDIGRDEYTSSGFALLITEVMANARTESTGEFVEIHNAGAGPVDLDGLVISDGDSTDVLTAWDEGTTELAAGEYAVVIDPDYAGDYTIDAGVTLVTAASGTTLGNGMTTSDPVTLYESDGTTIIATFSFPADPGDGVSMEMKVLDSGDVPGNWKGSQCASGSSPGATHCFPESGDPSLLQITEVLANAVDESTGEFVEIYNPTDREIDAGGLIVEDGGGYRDTLVGFQGGSTVVGPDSFAVILDPGFAYQHFLPSDAVLLTTEDSSIGNGLSTSDTVTLYASDGTTVISAFTDPSNPGDGVSLERTSFTAHSGGFDWEPADDHCARAKSPGRLNGAMGGICDQLHITEVMSNALDEDTGEFVEILNAGHDVVDLSELWLSDGDAVDALAGWAGGSTLLEPGSYAVVVDAEYAGEYDIPADALVVSTTDTTLGNGLSTTDEVVLYEPDGVHHIDAFLYPSNPGNGVSIERLSNTSLDGVDNWVPCTCAVGASAGADNCATTSATGAPESDYDVLITEVMSNAEDEDTGEFVELYNLGDVAVDLRGFVFFDGDAADTLFGFYDIYDTVLYPGEYAVILDQEYSGEYPVIPLGTLLLTTDDTTLGSGLATNDEIWLYEADGYTLVDSYLHPFNAGNGISVERIDYATGDEASNWASSTCYSGGSPGSLNCVSY